MLSIRRRVAIVFISLILIQAAFAKAKIAGAITDFNGVFVGEPPSPDEPLSLWYRRPAGHYSRYWNYRQKEGPWAEALPHVNGRLGAMVYGGILNEDIN